MILILIISIIVILILSVVTSHFVIKRWLSKFKIGMTIVNSDEELRYLTAMEIKFPYRITVKYYQRYGSCIDNSSEYCMKWWRLKGWIEYEDIPISTFTPISEVINNQ